MPVLEATAIAPTFDLPRAREPLTGLNQEPERTVPARLRELVDPTRIVVTPYRFSFGSPFSDNGYDADLAVLISELLDHPYTGISDMRDFSWEQIRQDLAIRRIHWRQTLEAHRRKVIRTGKINEFHKPLISVVAHTKDQMGVDMLSFVVNQDLHGKRVGSSFYRNWEYLLRERGYQYMTGDHTYSTNPGFFFEGLNMQRTTDLDPYIARRLSLERSEYRSVKFLNDYFERLVLGSTR